MAPSRGGRGARAGLGLLACLGLDGDGVCAKAASARADLFWRQGFLRVPGFADEREVAQLRSAMASLLQSWQKTAASGDGLAEASLSSLRSEGQEPDHGFLLDSAAKASLFLEPSAFDNATGRLKPGITAERAVRKVAHGLHFVEGPFSDYVHSAKVAELVFELGWKRPLVVQTLYRLMPALAAGVDLHQDSATLYTEPPSVLGLWLALEEATTRNGCLQVRRGSHNQPIRERLVRRRCAGREGVCLAFEPVGNASLQEAGAAPGRAPPAHPEDAFEAVEVGPGDLVVTHGALDHFSAAGTDPLRSRESVQVHVVEGGAHWPADNWLQYPPGLRFPPLERKKAPGDQPAGREDL